MDRRDIVCEVREVAPRTLRFIGSDESLDRYKTVIRVDGWRLGHYEKNPVFLWCHDASSPPIGRAVAIHAGEHRDGTTTRKALAFDIEFADRETYEFADVVYRLFKRGFLRATSVGFKNLKTRGMTEDERELYGEDGLILEENELYELSAVPVPGNPNALISELSAECHARGIDAPDNEDADKALEYVRAALASPARPEVTITTQTGHVWTTTSAPAPVVAADVKAALAESEARLMARLERIERLVEGMAKRAATASTPADDYGINERLNRIKGLFTRRGEK